MMARAMVIVGVGLALLGPVFPRATGGQVPDRFYLWRHRNIPGHTGTPRRVDFFDSKVACQDALTKAVTKLATSFKETPRISHPGESIVRGEVTLPEVGTEVFTCLPVGISP
jgi:hypothetical protein